MPDLGNAYVNIVPKAPGIESKVETLLNGGAPGAEKAGGTIGKKLLGGLAKLGIGAAIGKTLKDAFDAGGALQQSFGGLDTLYGDAAAGAKEYAMQAAAAGISANSYAEQAVSFGAALKSAYGGDTQAAMEAANTAILDMADNAAKMGTPLESIQTAYQGFAKQNYTMLDNLKLGYGGTKEEMERLLADAEAFSGVHYDISNLGDVYDAIHVVQGELGLTGVAAEEASSTLTGSLGSVKASWENVLGALTTGQGLEEAMANFGTSVQNFATVVLQMFSELAPQLPGLISGLADVIIENAPTFIASGIELIVQLAAGLIEAIPDLIAKLPQIWDSIKNSFKSINWSQLGKDLIRSIINGITGLASSLWNTAKNVVRNTWTSVKDAFSGIDWAGLGSDIINGIVNGVSSAASALWNAVKGVIRNALTAGKEEAEVASPSKLFANELGRWIPAGVAMGVEDNMAPLDSAMRGMVDGSLAAIQSYSAAPAAPAAAAGEPIDYDRLAAAISRRPVVIEGDAGKIFRVVQKTNSVRTRATAYNALAAGG